MLTAKWTGKHGHLYLPWMVSLLSRLKILLVSLLRSLDYLLLGILESLVCLLEVGHPLLHVIKALITWADHVLVSLESPSVAILPLIIPSSGLQ